jgi:hypothetical protein
LAALPQRHDVDRYERFQGERGIPILAGPSAQNNLAHVGDVEESRGGARVPVFPQYAERIMNGHGTAGERLHARTVCDVKIVER